MIYSYERKTILLIHRSIGWFPVQAQFLQSQCQITNMNHILFRYGLNSIRNMYQSIELTFSINYHFCLFVYITIAINNKEILRTAVSTESADGWDRW